MTFTLNRREFVMIGSLGITLGLVGKTRAAPQQLLQNIAARGQMPNVTISANGSKTRMKGVELFTIGAGGAKLLTPLFCNFGLFNATAREVNGDAAFTIRKAAITYNGVTVPLHFKGERSVEMAAGTVALSPTPLKPADFDVSTFKAGDPVYLRMSLDLPASGNIPAKEPMYLANEISYLYDPANEIDDIDGTTMAAPSGATEWANFPGAVMLLGQVITPVTSVVGLGDSIGNGSVDNAGNGANGGGWMRRATYAANLPYLSIARTGDKAQYIAGDHAKTAELIRRAGGDAALIQLGNNDIRDGSSLAQFKADLGSVYTMLRSAGISRIAQSLVTAETSSTDQTTTRSGQTIISGFGAGSVKEQANTWLAGLADNQIDDYIDAPSTVQSGNKWNVPLFETTLAAAVSPYAGSVSLNKAPNVGDFLVFDPATPANQDVTYFHVTSVTGTGPYTASLTFGPTKAHASGVTVRSALSGDGIHPQVKAHTFIAAKAAPALQRAKAIRMPWLNRAKSFEIDFINRRAQIGGIVVPISSFVSCVRASGGKASDGMSWFDFGNDTLRHVDGGGLYVETARANALPYSDWSGATGSTPPTGWEVNLRGLTATFDPFTESGLNLLRIKLTGTTTSSGPVYLREANLSVNAVSGQAWNGSLFVRQGANNNEAFQIGLNELTSSGSGQGINSYSAQSLNRDLTRYDISRTLTGASTGKLRYELNLISNASNGQAVNMVLDIAAPQLEQAANYSSPIVTSGTAVTRAADQVAMALPPGNHNLTFTFDDNSTQTVNGVSGNYTIPVNLSRRVIRAISGAAA